MFSPINQRENPSHIWAIGLAPVALALVVLSMRGPIHVATSPAITSLLPGMTVDAKLPPGTGLVVTSLRTGSEAEQDGVVVGDTVLAIERHPIKAVSDAEAVLHHDARDAVSVRLLHNHMPHDVVLHRDEGQGHGA